MIFVVLKAPGKGTVGSRIKQIHRAVIICMVGGGWKGGEWPQNHKKRVGLLAFSWFWQSVGGGRLTS